MSDDRNPDQVAQDFDFGFTAVTVEELDVIQEANSKLQASDAESSELQDKLDRIYNAVQPLLSNLKADPSKSYLYWPDRLEKIEKFADYLDAIYQGK